MDELLRMMKLMASHQPDESADEAATVEQFRRETLSMYLNHVDARTFWQPANRLITHRLLITWPARDQLLYYFILC